MEIRKNNSITAFATYKIKKCIINSTLSFLGILAFIYIVFLSFNQIEEIKKGNIDINISSFMNGFYHTLIILAIVLSVLLLSVIIYSIIVIVLESRKINYYKNPRFSIIERKEIEFDYKLWQTASKNSFHSQAFVMEIDGIERPFKTPIIFTNSKRIGLLKIPTILQSNSYVSSMVEIGYDKEKDEAIILTVSKQK